jgi:hypothetical protein
VGICFYRFALSHLGSTGASVLADRTVHPFCRDVFFAITCLLPRPETCSLHIRVTTFAVLSDEAVAVTTGSSTEPSSAARVLAKFLLEPRAVGPEKVLQRVKLQREWDITAIPKQGHLENSQKFRAWNVINPFRE